MAFNRLTDLDLHNKRVFIRADLNVPQDDAGNITDDTRIRASIPAIQFALDKGAAVMVTSHLGRPTEGEFKPDDSLAPIATRMSELMGREIPLLANWVDGGLLHRASWCCLKIVASTRARRKTTTRSPKKWRRYVMCTRTTHSAPHTAQKRQRTASQNSRGLPAPARCWRQNWTP